MYDLNIHFKKHYFFLKFGKGFGLLKLHSNYVPTLTVTRSFLELLIRKTSFCGKILLGPLGLKGFEGPLGIFLSCAICNAFKRNNCISFFNFNYDTRDYAISFSV